jgi:membrane protein YqaA with SNARE-associated domain
MTQRRRVPEPAASGEAAAARRRDVLAPAVRGWQHGRSDDARMPPPHETTATPTERQPLTFADGVTTPIVHERLGREVWILGAIMVVTALVTAVLMLRDFRPASYLYLLFYSIPSNSAVSIFPHEPAVIFLGGHGSILLTALAATLGTLVAGYLDHSVFVPVMNLRSLGAYKDGAWYRRAATLFMRRPFLVLTIAGVTPLPFFPFKFLSFSVHYPLGRYLGALAAGRFPRYLALAWLGQVLQIPAWTLLAFFAVFLVVSVKGVVPAVLRQVRAGHSQPETRS